MKDGTPEKQANFVTTHWSIVLRAGGPNGDEARDSLGQLAETYWYPLYAFSRRRGQSDPDALDLTQGFFTHLLQSQALDSVSPHKGRFRSFLLAAFKNYIANERRAAGAQRRGGGVRTTSLTHTNFQTRYACEPADTESPDLLFERKWVESLLERVLQRLANDYQQAQKTELFELLKPHLTNHGDVLPRTEISRRTNLSVAAVGMSLHRMRRRYGELLREEVSATVETPVDIEDELRELMAIVASAGSRSTGPR